MPLEVTWFFWINMLKSCRILYYMQALMALRSLLQLNNTYAQIFRDYCHLESVLKNLGQHLQELMLDHRWGDFATDVEALRQEVVSIFLGKIELTT
ncbi:hypothetical protein SUGI_0962260 [Cryptomeria japonica]|nr:hypothetical protein SUGI_0962260 [Cryptomeria japonica]